MTEQIDLRTGVAHRWKELGEIARRHGLVRATLWVGHGLATQVLRIAVSRVMWLDAERVNASIELPPEFICRFLTADEVKGLAVDPLNSLSAPLEGRISLLGHQCLAAFYGERMIAYCWYATGRVDASDHWGIPVTLPPNVALSYNAFTYPDFRGRRIHGGLKVRALQALAPSGVRALVSLVRIANWASLQSLRRMGYVDLGLLVALGLENKRVLCVPRRAAQRGIQFQDQAPRTSSGEASTNVH